MKPQTSTEVLDQYWLVHSSVSYAQANGYLPIHSGPTEQYLADMQ